MSESQASCSYTPGEKCLVAMPQDEGESSVVVVRSEEVPLVEKVKEQSPKPSQPRPTSPEIQPANICMFCQQGNRNPEIMPRLPLNSGLLRLCACRTVYAHGPCLIHFFHNLGVTRCPACQVKYRVRRNRRVNTHRQAIECIPCLVCGLIFFSFVVAGTVDRLTNIMFRAYYFLIITDIILALSIICLFTTFYRVCRKNLHFCWKLSIHNGQKFLVEYEPVEGSAELRRARENLARIGQNWFVLIDGVVEEKKEAMQDIVQMNREIDEAEAEDEVRVRPVSIQMQEFPPRQPAAVAAEPVGLVESVESVAPVREVVVKYPNVNVAVPRSRVSTGLSSSISDGTTGTSLSSGEGKQSTPSDEVEMPLPRSRLGTGASNKSDGHSQTDPEVKPKELAEKIEELAKEAEVEESKTPESPEKSSTKTEDIIAAVEATPTTSALQDSDKASADASVADPK